MSLSKARQLAKDLGTVGISSGASGRDVYTFTIFKTGSGTTDYLIFGAATNYA